MSNETNGLTCEGACEPHEGEVRTVLVKDHDTAKDWGAFNYCAVARDVDRRRGFSVVEAFESNEERAQDEPCGLTHKQLAQALANIGFDITCGECAMLFFTGYTGPTSRTDMLPPGHESNCKTLPRTHPAKETKP